jgi:hypothetical protein
VARTSGNNPDLRASDADRDAAASELAQHFQDGRLDQAEFNERLSAAMAARTERDLDELLTDLPRTGPQPGRGPREPDQAHAATPDRWQPAQRCLTSRRARVLGLLPLVVAAAVVGGLLSGGWQHGWPFAPVGLVWLIVPILVGRAWVLRGRRQWR